MDGGTPALRGSREAEVGGGGCAFPLAAANRGGFGITFCGAPCLPGSAYCPPHHARCHLPPGSAAARRRLREIEGLAAAAGGRQGARLRQPTARQLRRLQHLGRALARPECSLNVPKEADNAAAP